MSGDVLILFAPSTDGDGHPSFPAHGTSLLCLVPLVRGACPMAEVSHHPCGLVSKQDCDMGQEQHHCTRLSGHSCCSGKVGLIGLFLSKSTNTNCGETGETVGWDQVWVQCLATGQGDTDFLPK